MAVYSFGANKGSANVKSVALLVGAASTPRRSRLNTLTIGCGATPADATYNHIIQRCTTAGTGATLTVPAIDPADPVASTMVCKDTVTSDPTLTANTIMENIALNQRTTYRYVAVPGLEIITPATASNGLMMGVSAATTVSFDYSINFREE